jgi:hypothetical protein
LARITSGWAAHFAKTCQRTVSHGSAPAHASTHSIGQLLAARDEILDRQLVGLLGECGLDHAGHHADLRDAQPLDVLLQVRQQREAGGDADKADAERPRLDNLADVHVESHR